MEHTIIVVIVVIPDVSSIMNYFPCSRLLSAYLPTRKYEQRPERLDLFIKIGQSSSPLASLP